MRKGRCNINVFTVTEQHRYEQFSHSVSHSWLFGGSRKQETRVIGTRVGCLFSLFSAGQPLQVNVQYVGAGELFLFTIVLGLFGRCLNKDHQKSHSLKHFLRLRIK